MPVGSKRIIRSRTDATTAGSAPSAAASAAVSTDSRPEGSSSAIMDAPISRSAGSWKDRRSCSARCSRRVQAGAA